MRLLRPLTALLALAAGFVGIPAALVALGGNPVPGHLSWSSVTRALLRPDDGTIVISLIALIGWLAWLIFAAALLVELVNVLSGFRVRLQIPGLAGPQHFVTMLLLAVVAVHSAPAAAAPVPPAPTKPTTTPRADEPLVRADPPRASRSPLRQAAPPSVTPGGAGGGPIHVVKRGDDLWSLAERYYGQGRDWRRIAAANPDVLTGGPDRLQVGWRLLVPDGQHVPDGQQGDTSDDQARSTVVHAGDTLSSIAQDAYGDTSKWREVFEANREQLEDPDEIDVGARLRLPELEHSQPRERQGKAAGEPSTSGPERDSSGRTPTTAREGEVPTAPHPDPAEPPPAPPPPAPEPTPAPGTEPPGSSVPPQARPSSNGGANSGRDGSNADAEIGHDRQSTTGLALASVGGLLAAGVLGGLSLRRRSQLQARPVGRRIQQPPVAAQAVESVLGRRQSPLGLAALDLATRAIAAHCLRLATALPPLVLAKVSAEVIELVMREPADHSPVGFQVAGRSWMLDTSDAGYLASVPGMDRTARPFPALVSLGRDGTGAQVLVDLEALGLLRLDAETPELAEAMLAALAVELSFAPWADEMALTLVGASDGLSDALGEPNVTEADQVEELLARLEQRATGQRAYAKGAVPAQSRIDSDLSDPWAPEIVLVHERLTDEQQLRLAALATEEPRVAMAAVVVDPVPAAPWTLALTSAPAADPEPDSESSATALLQPLGLQLVPQLLNAPTREAVHQLIAATGTEETTPAPWWDHGDASSKGPPPDNVTYLGTRTGGWGRDSSGTKGTAIVDQEGTGPGPTASRHPILRLLGPVELVGARGAIPPRAAKQCLEYCGWLLEHPGTTAQAMASALVVAEGTRRSNMSRLRTWLGADDDGEPYLPDAYTGRIMLHPSVSSDWQRLQILTAAGVNKTSTSGLRTALDLVRGAPLADAAPGQWHWAEELRTDMISVIRDIGVEVASRALGDHDLDLARWAAARALVAAPGDELLLAARVRTEHQAGNVPETERLTLQLAAQSRTLGVDLHPDTVVLLQEVMEGRVRARLA